MPELSRSQVAVYAAVALGLLLVGVRAIRAEGSASPPDAAPPGGGLSVRNTGGDLVVDVAGAVRRPGVYRLPAGARVLDALRRAGGTAPGAALAGINRAARLTDGQQVVVPDRAAAVAVPGEAAPEVPIGLGAATVEQLESIDGIGPVTAEKILEYRDSQGGLSSVEQLDEVGGIGPATMESLRARLQP